MEKIIQLEQAQMDELVQILKISQPATGFSGYKLDLVIISYFNKFYDFEISYSKTMNGRRLLDASKTFIPCNPNYISIREIINELIRQNKIKRSLISVEGSDYKRHVFELI